MSIAIWKAIKSGKLSASRGDNGEWQIDPAELARAFPLEPLQERPRGRKGMDGDGAREAALEAENAQLRERLADKDALIAAKDAQIADALRQRDKWIEQAEAIRLLTAPPARPGFLKRLLGK